MTLSVPGAHAVPFHFNTWPLLGAVLATSEASANLNVPERKSNLRSKFLINSKFSARTIDCTSVSSFSNRCLSCGVILFCRVIPSG